MIRSGYYGGRNLYPVRFHSFFEAQHFLYSHLLSWSEKKTKPGEPAFFRRAIVFLKELGDPQEKVKTVHIAGTSGKTSTTFLLGALLQGQGFKVGVMTSPHLKDVRERMLINGQLISDEDFCRYAEQVIPAIERTEASEWGMPSFFEGLVGLGYLAMVDHKVDYVVAETGLGGTWDATNCVRRSDKLAVITRIGLDHTKILGSTYSEIAGQKAGIIQEGNEVVALHQLERVMQVVTRRTRAKKAHVQTVDPRQMLSRVKTSDRGSVFDLTLGGKVYKKVELGASGSYQLENMCVALMALETLAKRDGFHIKEAGLRQALATVRVPGRMEQVRVGDQEFILDGAHNPQKMRALVRALQAAYPGQKLPVLLAFKSTKEFRPMLKVLLPIADSVIATTFDALAVGDMRIEAQSPEHIAAALHEMGSSRHSSVPELKKAFFQALKKTQGRPLLVTGSLYLLSQVYPLLAELASEE